MSAKNQTANIATFLGTTTLQRMLNAVCDKNDPLYKRNTFSECLGAQLDFEKDPRIGNKKVYVYHHSKENFTVMTNIEDDVMGLAGSSAGFEGRVEL